MTFKRFIDPETSTYTYLISDRTSNAALIIDPVKENVSEYISYLKKNGLELKLVMDTHIHADHVTAAGLLRKLCNAQSVIGKLSQSDCASVTVDDGEILECGQLKIKCLHTPGHTPCHMSFLIENMIFTGDALFIDGCGRTDFQGGSAEQLWESIQQKLFTLPDETLVYPGHDYQKHFVSSIRQEKERNPRFKDQTKESFIQLMNNLDLPDPKKIMQAVPANQACGQE